LLLNPKLLQLGNLLAQLVENFFGSVDGLFGEGRNRQLRLVDLHCVHSPLVHSDVANLLNKVFELLLHICFRTVLVIKRS
jgi:hypothetical protein